MKVESVHHGFYMVEEEAIRHLKRTFGEPAALRKASAAYHTLLRIANLRGSDTFEERIGALADDMGYAYKEAAAALQLLKLAGLCEIQSQTVQGSKEKGPNIFTVKRRSSDFGVRLPEKEGRYCENGRTLGESQNTSSFTESTQELPQEHKNKNPKNEGAAPSRSRFIPPTLVEAEEEAVKCGMPKEEGSAFIDRFEACGWKYGNGQRVIDWRAAMRVWKRTFLRLQTFKQTKREYTRVPEFEEL